MAIFTATETYLTNSLLSEVISILYISKCFSSHHNSPVYVSVYNLFCIFLDSVISNRSVRKRFLEASLLNSLSSSIFLNSFMAIFTATETYLTNSLLSEVISILYISKCFSSHHNSPVYVSVYNLFCSFLDSVI